MYVPVNRMCRAPKHNAQLLVDNICMYNTLSVCKCLLFARAQHIDIMLSCLLRICPSVTYLTCLVDNMCMYNTLSVCMYLLIVCAESLNIMLSCLLGSSFSWTWKPRMYIHNRVCIFSFWACLLCILCTNNCTWLYKCKENCAWIYPAKYREGGPQRRFAMPFGRLKIWNPGWQNAFVDHLRFLAFNIDT